MLQLFQPRQRASLRLRLLTLAVLAASLPWAATAEQPSWDGSANGLLVIRRHELGLTRDNIGLWSIDPDTGSTERLRHFTTTSLVCNPDFCPPSVYGSLSAGDGMVVFQGWPMNLELEAGSYRVIRRTPALADPAARGWAVLGPRVSTPNSVHSDLAIGTYGFGWCLLNKLLGAPSVGCLPYTVAGESIGACYEPFWPLLHRGDEGGVRLATLLPSLDCSWHWPSSYTLLSLDPERRACGSAAPRGVELIPFEDGT
jgi:hypothetical protein